MSSIWVGRALSACHGGQRRRYLLLLVALVAPICAFLPNATTVILVAPVIIGVARALKVDFVGPMVLTAVVSNSAGMLTLVGDPATFLVGSSIGMSFADYLYRVSLGGLLAVLVILPLLPRLMPDVWAVRLTLPPAIAATPIQRPSFVALALVVLFVMVALFLFGEALPTHIVPPAVAIIGATLALLVIYGTRVEPVDAVLRDVDWKTLIFLGAIFVLVQGFTKTGLLAGLSIQLYGWFGADLTLVALLLLAGIGMLSSLLANIPVVAAALIMTKGYLVAAAAVPENRPGGWLHRLARRHHAGLHRHDVRRHPRRQRHPDRRLGQHRGRRHLRHRGRARDLRALHALRRADHPGATGLRAPSTSLP